jgi:lipoprotein NlpI
MPLRVVLIAILLLAAKPAVAQLEPARKLCNNAGDHFPLDDVIFGCSAMIKDERASATDIAAAHSVRGYVLGMRGEFDAALADHGKAIELSPNFETAFARRGATLHLKGELDRAAADYSKAIALNSNYAWPLFERGRILAHRGELDKAMADYDAAIKLTPQDAIPYALRGSVQQAKGNLDLAIKDFAKAVELDPKQPDWVNYLGFARYNNGDFKGALPFLRPAVQSKDQAYIVLIRYLAQMRIGESAAAAELERNAGGLPSKDWPHAVAELYLGRRSPADTLEAATTDHYRCEAHFYIGKWHLLKGETSRAATELKIASDTCPKTIIEYSAARAELQRLRQ